MLTPEKKYQLYEKSVQDPEVSINWVEDIYKELNNGKVPTRFKEDFSGTFWISSEWVKLREENEAWALDLDPEPLRYGKKHRYKALTPSQRRRLHVKREDVTKFTRPKVDATFAGNFSFNIFKEEKSLQKYFKAARRSLRPGGVLVLEACGGPGFIEKMKERRSVSHKGKKLCTYIWEQRKFDPITHDAFYTISFKIPHGPLYKDAFTYDWRLWTIPELRKNLSESGFEKTFVWWEQLDEDEEETGDYKNSSNGDNAHVWTSYIVGQAK